MVNEILKVLVKQLMLTSFQYIFEPKADFKYDILYSWATIQFWMLCIELLYAVTNSEVTHNNLQVFSAVMYIAKDIEKFHDNLI